MKISPPHILHLPGEEVLSHEEREPQLTPRRERVTQIVDSEVIRQAGAPQGRLESADGEDRGAASLRADLSTSRPGQAYLENREVKIEGYSVEDVASHLARWTTCASSSFIERHTASLLRRSSPKRMTAPEFPGDL